MIAPQPYIERMPSAMDSPARAGGEATAANANPISASSDEQGDALAAFPVNDLARFLEPRGGCLLMDKQRGWTSFDVVKKTRSMTRVRKLGHAGTLDPNATGLLILCSNGMTKDIDRFQALEKEYEGECLFGAVTASYDIDTPVEERRSVEGVTPEMVSSAAALFQGEIEQYPPMFSAVKVRGRRLYDLARKGVEVERTPRRVRIHSFRVDEVEMPRMRFTVVCSKGTYIRSLIHDLGRELTCGAHLTALRRTRIGGYRVQRAMTVDQLSADLREPGLGAYAGR